MPLNAGTRLGPYEILAPLGAGGMGEVYRARDPRLGREVAIKLVTTDGALSSDRLRRFETEARAVALLSHPNVVTVFDVGTHRGQPYLVLELLEGETLRESLRAHAPTLRQAVTWALEIARGLAAAHERGIVHRDLKPENVVVAKDGRLKILDFGLAKLHEPLVQEEERESPTETRQTHPGVVLGTVGYMSPEQVRGEPAQAPADVFALGVLLYEMVSGRRAFPGSSTGEILASILRDEPPALVSPALAVPPSLEAVVRRCLAKRPSGRFASAAEVGAALETVLPSLDPTRASTARPAGPRRPYPGLAAFTEADAERFFGREAEVEALWRKLESRRLLALIGPSGAGKTSFARAGLVPTCPRGWAAIVTKPGAAPFRGLAQALAPAGAGDADAVQELLRFDDPDVAFSVLRRWRQGSGEALLVVDQFEELFTLCDAETQGRFATLLGRLVDEADVHVVLSLRDDFLIRCHEQEALASVFAADLTPLLPLSGDGLRSALVEPAKKEGFAFEDEALVEEMLESVEGARSALPLLAFAVSCLWERRDRETRLLTRAAYEEIGGVAGALAQHAEQTLEHVGGGREGIVREIFRNLVTSQGTRASADREELLSVFPDRNDASEVLGALVDARLLTSYEVPAAEGMVAAARHRIEVVHESLLKAWPRLVRWRAQDEEGSVLRDQLKQAAHLWEEKDRSPDLLWSGAAYQEFQVWRRRYPGGLTATEEAFAAAMAGQAGRRRRRRRLLAAVAFLAVLGLAAFLEWSRQQTAAARDEALLEAQRAEASKLVALGRAELAGYPSAALAYSIESLSRFDSVEARLLALEALWQGPVARVLTPPGGHYWSVAMSPNGRWLAATSFAGPVLLYPDDGGAPRRLLGHPPTGGPRPAAFGKGNDVLATGAVDEGQVLLWSVPDGQELGRWDVGSTTGWRLRAGQLFAITREPKGGRVRLLARPLDGGETTSLPIPTDGPLSGWDVDPVGDWVAYRSRDVVSGQALNRPDDRRGAEVIGGHAGTVGALAFDPRRRWLVSADESGQVRIWPLKGGRAGTPRTLSAPALDVQFLPAFDASGMRLALGAAATNSVLLWDLTGPPDAEPLDLRRRDVVHVKAGVFSPDGNWLATTHSDSISFWSLDRPVSTVLARHRGNVAGLGISGDGQRLVSCGDDGLREWPLSPGTSAQGRPITLDSCYGLALSPGGSRVLSGGPGTVDLRGLAGGSGRRLREGPGAMAAVAFDREGRRAAAAPTYAHDLADMVLRVWDLDSGDVRVLSLRESEDDDDPWAGGIQVLEFDPDGRLFSAGRRGLRRWDLDRGLSEVLHEAELRSMDLDSEGRLLVIVEAAPSPTALRLVDVAEKTERVIESHGTLVQVAALSPRGDTVVTGDSAGVVRVGPVSGAEPHLLFGHRAGVRRLTVSPDGEWIASAAGSEIRLWPMPDVTKPPLQTLPHDELLTRLRNTTNLVIVEDAAAATGYLVQVGPFPGWTDAPEW